MQILIALCYNILKIMTVVISGGPWLFDHMVEAQIYADCAHTCGKMRVCLKSAFLQGAPSQRRFDL